MEDAFVDIHCHLLPAIDDGSPDWSTTLGMAQMAVADGTRTIIVTPHQLGNFAHNLGPDICARTAQAQGVLDQHGIELQLMPGGDVRIEDSMIDGLASGDVLSLGNLREHVLLELPHELYFPLEGVLAALLRQGMTGILSHPERNRGLLREPELVPGLVDGGCLMQVTAGSLMGTFGPHSQALAEWMLSQGLVHFIATDAHGIKSRRPLMGRAFDRVAELTDESTATDLCCYFPSLVASGKPVPAGRRPLVRKRGGWRGLFSGKKVG
ncbi:MAG: CpsB/CapC family capsule biosynthesis tyrosine phosphatase [Planctomycetota bacterium]